MMSRIIPTAIFIAIFYILPLLPKAEMILTVQIGFVVLTCAVLLIHQPPLSINESKANQNRDKSSVWVIMGTVGIIELLAVIEWAYVRSDFHTFSWDYLTLIGTTLILGGAIFRTLSIMTLGKHFTATVRIQEEQTIIQHGAYKYVRHPSYLGAYLVVIGTTVFLHAYISIAFSIVAMFIAYWYRISVEETALVEDFGDQYKNYQEKTKRIIPFIY